jgi:carnitine 3-dehydrogenase
MRWAFMGSFLTYHLAGGPGGMRAFIKQFDPTLELPWTDLKFPNWNAELERRLIEGCEAQAGGLSVAEIEAKRNDILVDMMRLFRQHRIGAGNVLAREEERIYGERAFKRWKKGAKVASPLKLHRGEVQPGWVDYNGHMSDAFYLCAFGEAMDALFRYVGDDEDYRAAGLTFFTAETHVNYFREMRSGEPMRFETQLVGLDPKRMHVFHRMIHGRTGDLVATNEIMLLHVHTKTRRTAPMRADVHSALEAVWKEHKKLSKPRELGRTMKVGGAKKLSQSRQRGRRR